MQAACWLNAHIFESPLCSGDLSFGGVPDPIEGLVLVIAVAQWAQLAVSVPQHTAPGLHDRIAKAKRREGYAIPVSRDIPLTGECVGDDLEEGAVVLGVLKVFDHDGQITWATVHDIPCLTVYLYSILERVGPAGQLKRKPCKQGFGLNPGCAPGGGAYLPLSLACASLWQLYADHYLRRLAPSTASGRQSRGAFRKVIGAQRVSRRALSLWLFNDPWRAARSLGTHRFAATMNSTSVDLTKSTTVENCVEFFVDAAGFQCESKTHRRKKARSGRAGVREKWATVHSSRLGRLEVI